MSINDTIAKAIQDNLPSATAGELTKYLEKARETEEDLQNAKDNWDIQREEIETLKHDIDVLRMNAETHRDLIQRDNSIRDRENNLKVTIAENRAQQAVERSEDIMKLAEIVFKNPRLRISEDTWSPVKDNQGYDTSHHVSRTTVIGDEQ